MSQPFGKDAQQYLAKLILGKEVCVMWQKRDQYGRILGIVYAGEGGVKSDLNLRLVKEGYAWHYSYFDQTPEYIAAEKEARAAKRGLWAAPDPVNPYQWRKAHR